MNNQMELFGRGGLKDEGGEVDEVSGNKVPVGGTKEGVRDDIPANVSEGEFIFPADVVRFVGLDKLMSIRQDAKMGLKQMEAMGQMGNSDEATVDDDVPFSMADLIVVGGKGEPMELAGGGFIPVEDYTVVQDMIEDRSDKAAAIDKDQAMSDMIADNTTKSAVIDKEEEVQNFEHGGVPHKKLTFSDLMGGKEPRLVMYVNEAGDKMMIPFVDGVPLFPIPAGYTEYVPPELVEGEVASPEDLETAAIVAAINPTRREKEYDPMKGVDTKPVDWMDPEMDGARFLEFVKERNSYGAVRNTVEAVFSFIPVVGFLGKMAFRDSDKKILEALNARAKAGEFNTPELQKLALFTAGEVEKAGTSLIGKAIEVVGDLLGKTKEEVSAVVQLQSIIDETVKDKRDINGTQDDNGSLKPDPAIIAAIAKAVTIDTDKAREDGIAPAETNITPTGRDIGSAESIVSGMNAVPTSSSTEIVPDSKNPNVAGDYSGDVVNSKYTGKDALPYYTSGYGVIDRTNTDFVDPENAKFRASQLQNRRISDTLTNENKYKSQTKDTNRLEYGANVSGGVELQDMLTGDSTIFSKTSNSLRNIFAGPDDGTRAERSDAIPSGPTTIAKTEGTSTEPVNTTTGTPGFRDRSTSSTTDLESTQVTKRPTKRTNPIQAAYEKIKGIVSGFDLSKQYEGFGNTPIVNTDDGSSGSDDASRDSRNDPKGSDITQTLIDQGKKDLRQDQSVVDYSQTASGKDYDLVAEEDDYDAFEDIGATTTPTTTVTSAYGGAGPRAEGGLIARPKKKIKRKTTNKRGLAARK